MKINGKGQQLATVGTHPGLELAQVLWDSRGSHGHSLQAVGESWLLLCISLGILMLFLESWPPNLLCDGHMATEGTVPPRTHFGQPQMRLSNVPLMGFQVEQMRT